MANYLVFFKNSDVIEVENVDSVSVNNETYFLTKQNEDMNTTVEFSAPLVHIWYIQKK